MAQKPFGQGAYGYAAPFPQEDHSEGAYKPQYHFQAAKIAGFAVGTADSNPRTLYVGNLDPNITDEFIGTLFGQIAVVTKVQVIYDPIAPYAFVEFADHYGATQALGAMNGRNLLGRQIKVNWATQPAPVVKMDTSKHFHVFVGDLSPEVDNKALWEAFTPFGALSDAKVIRDPLTLKSKGYGFVSYPKREEAERAIEQMNGQWVGRRTIRTNWATRKPMSTGESTEYYKPKPRYEDVYNQTGPENTSVYMGNAPENCTDTEIRAAFSKFGRVTEVRHFKQQGFAFVKFETKDAACRAIMEMNGADFYGTNLKCSWGKVDTGTPHFATAELGAALTSTTTAYDPAAAQQYYAVAQQYYQQYYNNPQMMNAWASYYQHNGGIKEEKED